MPQTTVLTTATPVITGSTVDTLLTVGTEPIRVYTGSVTGVALSDYTPIDAGDQYIFPAGVSVTAWSVSGSAQVWTMGYGV